MTGGYRKTSQLLMPADKESVAAGQYDIYPSYPLGKGKIEVGYDALARLIVDSHQPNVILDGFPGVLWDEVKRHLSQALGAHNLRVVWQAAEKTQLPSEQIDRLIEPFLGGDDPLFGYRFSGSLRDFFDGLALAGLILDAQAHLNILYGTGAALAGWRGLLVYFDVPKNEIQFRARSKSIKNLGACEPLDPKPAYKRSYFVDWVAANRHKASLLPQIDVMVDEQRSDEPAFILGDSLREGLRSMARTCFRVRPWFEPGPWGGQWIKRHIPQLPKDVPNYAWSFELITPENGILFESDGNLLEVSFDTLMFQEYQAVLGESAPNFKYEFPIRYDFLDTFDGGNLSIQVHPRPEFIREHFGETFTQDETYYILDAAEDARVYLGLQEDAAPEEFKEKLLESARTNHPVDIDRYVHSLPVKKHDLLLIPNGTVHGSGKNNLVLEISATPYIFTFKMYDWLRLDLDGNPRALNIQRAFENLYTDRKGKRIDEEFVSKQTEEASGDGWRKVHCPTHPNHFYDVQRLEFNTTLEDTTSGMESGSCHVMSMVEGQTVLVETEHGCRERFNYAETFVIPAAAGRYRLTSENRDWIKVVKAFVKPSAQWKPGVVPHNDQPN